MHTPRLLADRAPEPAWRVNAQCRQVNAAYFFAPPHFETRDQKQGREGAARALCKACPVRQECLEYALAVEEPYGIWGGLNVLERRRLLRRQTSTS